MNTVDWVYDMIAQALSEAEAKGYGRGYKDAVDIFYADAKAPRIEPVFTADEAIDWQTQEIMEDARAARGYRD